MYVALMLANTAWSRPTTNTRAASQVKRLENEVAFLEGRQLDQAISTLHATIEGLQQSLEAAEQVRLFCSCRVVDAVLSMCVIGLCEVRSSPHRVHITTGGGSPCRAAEGSRGGH